MRIAQLPSFARAVKSYERIDKMTRPNCLCFKMGQGMTKEHIWKIIESIGFSTKPIVGIVDKKANFVDITCQSRQNVLSMYEKLLNVDKISNLRLFESDKITVAIHWVPAPFPIDRLKNYCTWKPSMAVYQNTMQNLTKWVLPLKFTILKCDRMN